MRVLKRNGVAIESRKCRRDEDLNQNEKANSLCKENAEWDRDEVYNIIMNYESLYKRAMELSKGDSKTALRKLKAFAKEVGLDNTPRIRLSDKGALLVAARILEDA